MSNMVECKICSEVFNKKILLTNHIKNMHKLSYKEYYDMYLKTDGEGICQGDNCNNPTKFERGTYRQFCSTTCARKSSIVHSKICNTCQERYNDIGLQSKEIKEKAQNTCIEKYGVINPYLIESVKSKSHSNDAREKAKQTSLKLYGVDNVLRLDKNKQRAIKAAHTPEVEAKRIESIKKNNLEKYGVEFTCQYELFILKNKQKRLNKIKQFCIENDCTPNQEIIAKYGTGWLQSGTFKDALIKHKAILYVKNSYLDKIANYEPITVINRFSKFEEEVLSFVNSIYNGNILHNNRKIITPFELDLYIPDKKVAIECNGVFWHSINNGTKKDYHLNKTILCEEQNIRLIHIFENEWNDNKEVCKSIIASALGIYKNRIYARNCYIKEISTKDTKMFININNLKVYKKSSYKLGLFYNNELMQIITINKRNELVQTCTKLNTQVIGGFSKLLYHQPYNILYSYIDRSKFTGNSYKYNFEIDSYTKPNYFYYYAGKDNIFKLYDCGKIKMMYKKF